MEKLRKNPSFPMHVHGNFGFRSSRWITEYKSPCPSLGEILFREKQTFAITKGDISADLGRFFRLCGDKIRARRPKFKAG